MTAATFGRKGLTESDDLARRKAAFIAAERARAGQPEPSALPDEWSEHSPAPAGPIDPKHRKSLVRAYMSWLLGGSFSSHRFYLGAYQSAVAQASLCVFGWLMVFFGDNAGADFLPTLGTYAAGAGSVWVLLDGIMLPSLRDKMAERARLGARRS